MEGLLGFRHSVATSFVPPLPFWSIRNKLMVRAKVVHQEDDSMFQAAVERASLRLQETNRLDPLFVDTYVGCLVPPDIVADRNPRLHPFCLATKFIDDKLLSTMTNSDDLRQVVLLTDGMDTRSYRLKWPRSTIIFDISPERVYKRAIQKLEDVGAKVARSCFLVHVPLESSSIQQTLSSKGFNGARPSIWVLQGLPIMNLESFKEILSLIDGLAMKDCLFLGELPTWLVHTDVEGKSNAKRRMESIFLNNGFLVNTISYNQIGENLNRELATEFYQNILFIAEHLRYSDVQMDNWRREFQRIEDGGDEEGFEEL